MLLMLLTTMTAWAGTTIETRTMTWPMNGTGVSGSELTNSAGNRLVLSKNKWKGNSTLGNRSYTSILTENYGLVGTEISFPDIVGKVTSVELTNVLFAYGGMCLKAGKDNSTLLCSTAFSSYDDENLTTYTSVFTFNGSLDVTASMPLKLMFMTAPGHSAPEGQCFKFRNGSITVTYEVEVEVPDPEDPGHNFSFNVSGNTLTATCNQQSQYHNCGLTGGKATLTLSVEDCTGNGDFTYNPASINLAEFNQQTGLQATKGDITYTNNTTGQTTTLTSQVLDIGSYTASVTVSIGGNNYTLTKDFNILAGHKVNNNYSQFSVSKISALEGDEVTITYTQLMDEILEGLTLTGATSGNNIAYTQSNNTYTFTMPAEDVNLSATITYPLNEDNITQSDDTYTIKTAEGWNYFCRRMEVDGELNGFSGKTVVLGDNITVTTSMAGSGRYPFKGTFDGDGHTLTFNHTASAPCSAPFQNTNGATIRSLHATGQIEGGIWNYIGGLVGSANGNLTIENCRVSTQISSTVSGIANNGGFVGLLSSQYNQCHITGCVFDGLIYNPEYSGTTYGCGGFIGAMSQYGYAILKDCLFLHGQYDNNNGKCELWWGNDNNKNSTFVGYDMSNGGAKFTNCFYVSTRGLKQGSPAVESTTAPTNFAHLGAPTNHCFMQTYGRLMVFNGKYYTPIYGDLVETYDYSGVKSYNIEYDDKPLGIPDITTQLWVPLLRYKRTFTNGKPVTVMMPFNFTKSAFKKSGSSDGLTGHFYEFKGINGSAPIMESANEVTEMKANTPYLYVPDDEPEYWYIDNGGSGVNIFTEGYDGGNKVAAYEGFELRGTYTERVWEENDPEIGKAYVYNANGELVPVAAGTRIRPTECYIIQTKKLMTGTDITVSIPSVEWTGNEIAFDETAVVVKDGETTLTLTTDYTVTAPTGTLQDTGDYPVTITGAGEYAGEVVAMFTIKGKPVTVKNDLNEDVPAATGDAEITQDQDGLTLTLTTPTESTTPHTVNVPQPVEVDHVSIDRTFEAGKACTLYLPFSIAADKIAGGTFNTFTGVDTSDPTEWIVQYSPVAGDIEANTPYIFLPNGTNGGKITVNNGENKVTICTANQHTTEKDQWDFIGTYERIKWTHNTADPEWTQQREDEIGSIYGFAAEEKSGATVGQFVQVTDNVWINPMRAYLKHTVVAPARSMDGDAATTELPSSMKVVIVEGTTGITSMEDVRGKMSDSWYSLDGRKLQGKPTAKGMYIHNGRKEVVK